jgi:hypothetical protein
MKQSFIDDLRINPSPIYGPRRGSALIAWSCFTRRNEAAFHRSVVLSPWPARAAQNPSETQQQALALEGEALAAWLLATRTVKKPPARRSARSARA